MIEGLLLIVPVILVVGVIVYRYRARKRIQLALLGALAVRATVSVVRMGWFSGFYTEDLAPFEEYGYRLSLEGVNAVVGQIETGAFLYSHFIGFIYLLIPRSSGFIVLLNVIASVCVVWAVWRMAFVIWQDHNAAIAAAWMSALFPVLVLTSSIPAREVLIQLGLTLGGLFAVRWFRDYRASYLLGAVTFMIIASAFHGAILVTVLGLLAVVSLVYLFRELPHVFVKGKLRAARGRNVFAFVTAAGVGIASLLSGWGGKLQPVVENLSVRFVSEWGMETAHGNLAYLRSVEYSTIWEAIAYAPIRIIHFLLGPFVWSGSGIAEYLGAGDAILWLLLLILIGISLRRKRKKGHLALLVIILAFLLVFAYGTANYGTAIRHRAKIAGMAIALASGAVSGIIRTLRSL